jgi:hypothetical protein
LTETELKKLRDSYDVAFIGLWKDKHMQSIYKGSVTELLILMGILMVDLHEDTGIALEDLGEGFNEVVAKEIALREKKK